MTKQLIQHISYMCLLLILGMANLIIAPLVSKIWLSTLSCVAAVFALIVAYLAYRRALKIAKYIDNTAQVCIEIKGYTQHDNHQPEVIVTEEDHDDIGLPV